MLAWHRANRQTGFSLLIRKSLRNFNVDTSDSGEALAKNDNIDIIDNKPNLPWKRLIDEVSPH